MDSLRRHNMPVFKWCGSLRRPTLGFQRVARTKRFCVTMKLTWWVRPSVAVCLCLGLGACSARSEEAGSLRLVASAGGWSCDRFSVEGDAIFTLEGTARKPLPAKVRWHLEGDLLAASASIGFSPIFGIVRRAPLASAPTSPDLLYGIVRVRRNREWKDSDLTGGIVVVAWILERKPVIVVPVPAKNDRRYQDYLCAVAAIPLSEETSRGTPVVLVLNGDCFATPEPYFRNAKAQHALAALYFEATEGRARAFAALPSVDIRAENDATLLWFAAEAGLVEPMHELLSRDAAASPRDTGRQTALHVAAANGRYDAMHLLLERKVQRAPIDVRDKTPFFQALSRGHVRLAAELAENAAAHNLERLTDLAISAGDARAVELLLGKGGEKWVRAQPDEAMARSIQLHNPDLLRLLLKHGHPADARVQGTPLSVIASAAGDVRCLQVLIDAGASIDAPAPDGRTALAAGVSSLPVVDLLLRSGASVRKADSIGATPLHRAVLSARAETIACMLNHGADPNQRDATGNSPLDLALSMQSRDSCRLLTDHGARLDPKGPRFDDRLVHAVALDLVPLLERAVEDGWNPATPLAERWAATQVARLLGAQKTIAWLASTQWRQGPEIEIAAARQAPPTIKTNRHPPDTRADEICPPGRVRIRAIVDDHGRFLFPRVLECTDDRLALSVLVSASEWRCQPGQRDGMPVTGWAELMFQFPARTTTALTLDGVDEVPTLSESSAAPDPPSRFRMLRPTVRPPEISRGSELYAPPPGQAGTADVGKLMDHEAFERRFGDTLVLDGGAHVAQSFERNWAILTFIVEKDGKTSSVQVVDAIDQEFAQAAVTAMDHSTFTPARKDGVPVRARMSRVVFADP
jgi:ankyrin repeat protein